MRDWNDVGDGFSVADDAYRFPGFYQVEVLLCVVAQF